MASTETSYSKRTWDAVANTLRGSELSSHPILATMYAEHRYIGTLLRLASDRFLGRDFSRDFGIPVAAGLIVGEALVGVANVVLKLLT